PKEFYSIRMLGAHREYIENASANRYLPNRFNESRPLKSPQRELPNHILEIQPDSRLQAERIACDVKLGRNSCAECLPIGDNHSSWIVIKNLERISEGNQLGIERIPVRGG